MRCGDGSLMWTASRVEVLPVMGDTMQLVGLADHAGRDISHDRIVVPAFLPEAVDDFHVFLGDRIAIVMSDELVEPPPPRAAVEMTGDDVPADPPFGEMIEGGEAPREQERILLDDIGRDAEANILRNAGHGADQHEGGR